MIVKSPCDTKCPKRNAYCHANCPLWKEYEKKRDAEYIERDKRRKGMYSACDRRAVNEKYKFILKSGKGVKSW